MNLLRIHYTALDTRRVDAEGLTLTFEELYCWKNGKLYVDLLLCNSRSLRFSQLNISSMRLLVSMRCFLSDPFAFAVFKFIDRCLLQLRSGMYFNSLLHKAIQNGQQKSR